MPLQFRKIPPQPKGLGAPVAAPFVLTLIQSGGGGSQRVGMIFEARLGGLLDSSALKDQYAN